MTKTILFRADSSSQIGTGHIMRDLVLASQLQKEFAHVPEQSDKCPRGVKIVFATQNLDGNINQKIIEAGYEIINLKTNDKDELLEVLKVLHPKGICRSARAHVDLLVIDHYDIDYKYETYIKDNIDVKIMTFDDTYEKHNCDILLNHNISADKKKYKDLVPKECEIRCGSEFTLLREEFRDITIQKRCINKKKEIGIFLAMGGADSQKMNICISQRLLKYSCIINIVTTSANKNLNLLKNFVRNEKKINLFIDANNISELANNSDIAIVTPSVIVNEVSFMQIPFIAILVAENQRDMFNYLTLKQLPTLEKENLDKLDFYIQKLMKNNFYMQQVEKITTLHEQKEKK